MKAVLFDLDGTLLDTLKDLHEAVNLTMDHYNYPRHTLDEVRQYVGNGLVKLMERAVPQELNLKEIGQVLDLSESRICQLLSQSMARLRSMLKDWSGN